MMDPCAASETLANYIAWPPTLRKEGKDHD